MAEGLFPFSAFFFMDLAEHLLTFTVFSPVTTSLSIFLHFTLPIPVTGPDELTALVMPHVRICLLNNMNSVNICIFLKTGLYSSVIH